MSSTYLGVLGVSGLLVGLFGFGVVYADTGRGGGSGPGSSLVAAGVGLGCLGGFLVPYVYGRRLRYAYFELIKPRPVTVSPYEWVMVSLATGLLTTAVVLGSYLVGTRYAGSRTNSDVS